MFFIYLAEVVRFSFIQDLFIYFANSIHAFIYVHMHIYDVIVCDSMGQIFLYTQKYIDFLINSKAHIFVRDISSSSALAWAKVLCR